MKFKFTAETAANETFSGKFCDCITITELFKNIQITFHKYLICNKATLLVISLHVQLRLDYRYQMEIYECKY